MSSLNVAPWLDQPHSHENMVSTNQAISKSNSSYFRKGVDLEGLQGRVGISTIKNILPDLLKELIKLYFKSTMGGLAHWVRGLAVQV